MATLNETDLMLHQLERRVQMAHAALLSHARHLAEQMTRLAVRLETDGPSASVNARWTFSPAGYRRPRPATTDPLPPTRPRLTRRGESRARCHRS